VLNKENGRYKRRYKRAIIWGTVIPGILYLIFAFVVMGITGQNTSMEAISGLVGTLGSKIVLLGSVFGFLATITSFFILGLSLRESYIYDFGFNKKWAWFITCFAPVVLFALGVQNFVLLITILGALIGLIECVVVILIHKKVIKRQNFLSYALICLFITGFICTVLNLVKH
jgi:tyrosine-specific transport protein